MHYLRLITNFMSLEHSMTLVSPLPDNSTTTGREVEDFSLNLTETKDNVTDMREKIDNMKFTAEKTRWALEQVTEVKEQATDFINTINSMQFSLRFAGKVGPLKLPAKFVDQVLEKLEKVAESVRDKAKSIEKKIADGGYIEKLEKAEDKLTKIDEGYTDEEGDEVYGLEDIEEKLATMEGGVQTMVSAFDAVGALLDPLENVANFASSPINDVLVPINRTYNEIEEELQFLDDAFQTVRNGEGLFDALADVAGAFGGINTKLGVLKGPLEAIQSALSPVDSLLDAVGFIYDSTVAPVIDFLLDKLGVTEILDRIGDEISKLLPDVDVLDEMEARITDAFDKLDGFIDGFDADIDNYIADVTDDVVNALGALAPDALRFGDEEANVVEGRTQGLDLLNGLEGNDTLYGYAEGVDPATATDGDMFVASSGDDFNYGGAGTDWLLLRGVLADYQITQFAEGAPLVFYDQQGRWGREVAEGIEQFVFNDGVYTLAELRDLGIIAAAESEGDDLIIGTKGDDVITPLGGSDTIDGRAGIDTYLIPDGSIDRSRGTDAEVYLERAIRDSASKEYDGWASVQGDRDYLDSIENVTIETDGNSTVVGSEGANVIITAGSRDIVEGRSGDDILISGGDDDLIIGGDGNDSMFGGQGFDQIIVAAATSGGGDYIDGGEGTSDEVSYGAGTNIRFNQDTHYFSDFNRAGTLRVDAENGLVEHISNGSVMGTDTIVGVERFTGSAGDDTIVGAQNEDGSFRSVGGGGGNDHITTNGSSGMSGGNGDDLVIVTERGSSGSGGGGQDTLDLRELDGARWLIRNGFDDSVDYVGFGDFEVERLGQTSGQVADNSLIRLFDGSFNNFETLLLGNGNDEFYGFGTARIEIFGAGGDDRMVRNQGNDGGTFAIMRGGDGDDYIEFNTDGNEAYGDAGNDRLIIDGSNRDMVLDGGTGDDFIRVTRFNGTLNGGDGYDQLSIEATYGVRSELDLLLGTATAWNISRFSGQEQAYVTLTDVNGIEEVIGGEEQRDAFSGTGQSERFVTRGGNDTLNGRGGDDELFAGDGNDTLDGGTGNDLMHGGAGNDRLIGGVSTDETDTASYANTFFDGEDGALIAGNFGAVTVDLTTGRASGAQGNDTLVSIENVIGSHSGDMLLGNGENNVISGGAGDDTIDGGAGNDILILGSGNDDAEGGSGNDTIVIGSGNATVNGGSGQDLVDFGFVDGSVVFDFATFSYTANLVEEASRWRDTGTSEARTWNSTVLIPQDVIEAEVSFANSDDDLTRALPGADDPDVNLFEVVFNETVNRFTGTFNNVEQVATGAGNDTLLGTEGENWMGGGAGDDLLLGGALQAIQATSSEAQVYRVYQATLARFPDSGGYDRWVDELETGSRTITQVTSAFVASIEFQNTYGALNNSAFVDLLYENVLDREGDEAGRAAWVGRLESGIARETVVLGFSESAEFKAVTLLNASAFATTADAATWVDDVFRLYQAALGRTPDYTGLQNWTDQLGSGTSFINVVTGFAASKELQNTYGPLDNTAFVEVLYRNVLDREADDAGLAGWTERLEGGQSRAQVLQGFSQSTEFRNSTSDQVIAYMLQQEGDTMTGGAGDDMLAGEIAADEFEFDIAHTGRDVVLSLDAWDSVSFTGFGYASQDEARANMKQAGQDVLFADEGVVVSFNRMMLEEMDNILITV
jgi:Ca2+-binding RTX toxin-like protein